MNAPAEAVALKGNITRPIDGYDQLRDEAPDQRKVNAARIPAGGGFFPNHPMPTSPDTRASAGKGFFLRPRLPGMTCDSRKERLVGFRIQDCIPSFLNVSIGDLILESMMLRTTSTHERRHSCKLHLIGVSLLALLTTLSSEVSVAQTPAPSSATSAAASASSHDKLLTHEQLEALVAPIALYPHALLAQVLMASTYPLGVVQPARWSQANPKVTGKQLEDAMQQQPWDQVNVSVNVNNYNSFNHANISNSNWQHDVNHDGVVHETDFGLKTKWSARKVRSFNPDSRWAKVATPSG